MAETRKNQNELRLHADAFEYTREGLRTREPLALEVGQHHRIVLVRPARIPTIGQGARGFPHDSAYPLVSTLSVFWSLADVGTPFTHHERPTARDGGTAFQVFGHCSASGDEALNKQLSDRRAKVGLALLRSDPELLLEVGDEDGWGTQEIQAMLRTLSCDPGPLDGELGVRTESALAVFQERYNAGVYHRRHDHPPATLLDADGRWNDGTKAALFEAFALAHGPAISESDVHPTHPANGCSEYNALSSSAGRADNRRLAVIAHPELPPHHQNAPCTTGDEMRCAVVDAQAQRCLYYRNHVLEETDAPVLFADPRWLWLGDDRYLLSALANLDEEAEVEFQVFDADERVHGPATAIGAWVDQPRSEVLRGIVRRGVAQVVWESGEAPSHEHGRPEFEKFPVFRVRDPATGSFSFAPWPEVQTMRVLVGSIDAATTQARPVMYRLRAGDGSYDTQVALADATLASSRQVVLEFEDVPVDARLTLSIGVDGRWAWNVIENVRGAALPGNCASGSQCRELPMIKPPPDPPVPDELDEDEDAANPWLEGDESLYEEPVYG